jgi:hypothetical protein
MRNEVAEELPSDLMSESRRKPDGTYLRGVSTCVKFVDRQATALE